jgi:hypothetical protein
MALFFFISLSFPYAEAPELRNVMPNSWRKVTRLSGNEEAEFLRQNATEHILDKIINTREIDISWADGYLVLADKIRTNTRIYRQQAGPHIFYRLITIMDDHTDFSDVNVPFLQSLLYQQNRENVLLVIASYNSYMTGQYTRNKICGSIDIIERGNGVGGILLSYVSCGFDPVNKKFDYFVKDQIMGWTEAVYFIWDEISKITSEDALGHPQQYGLFYPPELQRITISASDCLVDPQIPLRYGIQNAFDGDPATSFVENTEDDLMIIEFQVFTLNDTICQIAIINGYAQNETLYNNNNRVKKIGTARYEWNTDNTYLILDINDTKVLCDDCLSPQIFETDFARALYVLEIYKGNKYNDTCIAEIDIFVPEYGWIFGDINE